MNPPNIVVFDYGFGNVRSAVRALERVGAHVELTHDTAKALEADGLVVPGVGAFSACYDALINQDGHEIISQRISRQRPVLGICVGMQIMFSQGIEHGVASHGLSHFNGVVEKLTAPVVPHMGWNTVVAATDSVLFNTITNERFYFVHSYGVQNFDSENQPLNASEYNSAVTWTDYGKPFIAAIEQGPLVATQFHPEKSGDAGAQLLKNWLESF